VADGLVRSEATGASVFTLYCRGDVRLYRSDTDCTPKSKKGRALLAVLAAEQRPLTRVKIIDLLWSDRQEEQARASLRTLLANLKEQFNSAFDDLLAVDRERVALGPAVRSDLTDPELARQAGELFEGLDHIDPELDEWLRLEREKWANAPTGQGAHPLTPLKSSTATGRKMGFVGALALIAALGAILLTQFAPKGGKPETIAVLPLAGAVNDSERLFGEYTMAEVRAGLRASPKARVVGETTSREIAIANYDAPVVKQLFGADFVLSSSIRSIGEQDRIVARLIHAATGSELWSSTYVIGAGHSPDARVRIVRDLIARVRESLTLSSSKNDFSRWYAGAAGLRLAEAQRLILINRPPQALEARRILLELVAVYPDNVPALAALAEATMAACDHAYVGGTLPTADAREEARAYANRAIRLAPEFAPGYAALGASMMETADAIAPLERAVVLEPGNYLYQTRLGRALEFTDRYQEAYARQVEAVRLEPLAALPMINFIRAANQLERYNDINRYIAQFAGRRPDPATLGYVRAYYAFLRDDNVNCIRNFKAVSWSNVDPPQRNVLLFCLTALGENSAALRVVADEDSLRRDVLLGDVDLVEGRVRKLGRDFWRRHYESLGAAELLVSNGRSSFLLDQFDRSYNSVDDFIREGGFLTLYPQPLIVALRGAGRGGDARRLRDVLYRTMKSAERRPGGSEWETQIGASVAMADGDAGRAIALLERCAPTCIFTVLQRDISETALFRPLVGNPRFDRVIRNYRLMINRQRGDLGMRPLPLS